MFFIPAIDLLGGKVVRLYKGKRETAKVYNDDPQDAAKKLIKAGAEWIHVVDLNAAFGDGNNLESIKEILALGVKVEVGGGIRSIEYAQKLKDLGANRLIVGTKATDPIFLDQMLCKFGEILAVGVDVLDGKFMKAGWQEESKESFLDFVDYLVKKGVKCIIYTDISRDGTLEGTNAEGMASLEPYKGVDFIISGGLSTLREVRKIKEDLKFVYGIISGKAIYEGNIDVKEAISILK